MNYANGGHLRASRLVKGIVNVMGGGLPARPRCPPCLVDQEYFVERVCLGLDPSPDRKALAFLLPGATQLPPQRRREAPEVFGDAEIAASAIPDPDTYVQ